MPEFTVETRSREEFIEITEEVSGLVRASGIESGICVVYIPHTTAGVMINENADPSVQADVRELLIRFAPPNAAYRHIEGNADAHAKAVLTGSSVSLIVEKGLLHLGRWQGIYFCEFDGPRTRRVLVKTVRGSVSA
ncbi:MAG TPA: secondary thiamine-phosphate synthase enzyme YjbQ [bacterium]|nr:secondary thiamine-phosphate synthase enzyme YjbQ [bacterium]HPJ72911.1 secondary thiamine-phosphate synthase enzyme YjbQ [bacterium]HPQ66442.1 secondary thiamine-phosphate synthase enzyme YjbQ [bacterium]